MMKTFNEASQMIVDGKWLHIAGNEELIKKLPQGNWVGGSIEYFMTGAGGLVSDEKLFVNEISGEQFAVVTYDENTLSEVAKDAFDNGFSIIILPFDSGVHKLYAQKAAEFEDMFIKNILGWVSGVNLNVAGQTPISCNGRLGESYPDKAVVLHVGLPAGKNAALGIVNIFTPDQNSPSIEFRQDGFVVERCLIDGQEVALADYLSRHGVDTRLPIIGDYAGVGINISFKEVKDGTVYFYAPVFRGIQYHFAAGVPDYAGQFHEQLKEFKDQEAVFSCNCILNFLYGEFENKQIETFFGPVTFGEIAYQLVNQTLVYVTVSDE